MATARTDNSLVLIGLVGIGAMVAFIFLPHFFPQGTSDYGDHPAVGLALPQVELVPLTGLGEPTVPADDDLALERLVAQIPRRRRRRRSLVVGYTIARVIRRVAFDDAVLAFIAVAVGVEARRVVDPAGQKRTQHPAE